MCPRHTQRVVRQSMGAQIALYDPAVDILHVLNAAAALIWDLCDGVHTPDDMEKVIRSRFRVSTQHDVAQDVERTLALFAAKGLIELEE